MAVVRGALIRTAPAMVMAAPRRRQLNTQELPTGASTPLASGRRSMRGSIRAEAARLFDLAIDSKVWFRTVRLIS